VIFTLKNKSYPLEHQRLGDSEQDRGCEKAEELVWLKRE